MDSDLVTLLHATPRSELGEVMRYGLKASSAFDSLGLKIRQNVVYCWLRKEDDKMLGNHPGCIYVQVIVDRSRCRVAEMEFSSIAMMYQQGSGGKLATQRSLRCWLGHTT